MAPVNIRVALGQFIHDSRSPVVVTFLVSTLPAIGCHNITQTVVGSGTAQ